MIFPSLTFLLFFTLVFGVYWSVLHSRLKSRNLFLLVASYVFYGWWDWRFLILIVISSAVDFGMGLAMDKSEDNRLRKRLLGISLLVNLGLLGTFKYFDFFSLSFASALQSIGFEADPFLLNWVLPVGISFYTFQTLSYTLDLYARRITATRDPLAFFAFVAFFPQLVAGPIERASHLLPQFERRRIRFDQTRGADALRMILYGLFLKAVVADNLAPHVDAIFARPEEQAGSMLLLGAIYFGIQIYGDFAGYSLIARGTAALLGFDLMVNFRVPYFSRDMGEFWRRWHISLSTWFRDYVYIPLGGNRKGKWTGFRNVMLVFLISGLWHGANWTFLAWGLVHGLALAPLFFLKRHRKHGGDIAKGRLLPHWQDLPRMLLTFSLVTFAWVLFRAETLSDAVSYYSHMLDPSMLSLPTSNRSGIIWVVFVLCLDWTHRNHEVPIQWPYLAQPFRWMGYAGLCALVYYCGYFGQEEFIYFQF